MVIEEQIILRFDNDTFINRIKSRVYGNRQTTMYLKFNKKSKNTPKNSILFCCPIHQKGILKNETEK